VRLLVDANLSPVVSARLREAGHEAIHVFDVGFEQASDEAIVEYALEHDYVIVSADTDFAAILARLDRAKPSFVLLRHVNEMTPEQHAALLRANLDALAEDLEAGAVASFARGTIRVRRLPFASA
jgi:predicted nuclease of predicted toxin-antitoxin system